MKHGYTNSGKKKPITNASTVNKYSGEMKNWKNKAKKDM